LPFFDSAMFVFFSISAKADRWAGESSFLPATSFGCLAFGDRLMNQ
jgi:hypothetical protein